MLQVLPLRTPLRPGEQVIRKAIGTLQNLRSAALSKAARDTYIVAVLQVAAMGVAVVGGRVVTRRLGPDLYGLLATVAGLATSIGVFFEFGVSIATGLLLVRTVDRCEQQRIVGASSVLGLLIGGLFAAALFAASFAIDRVYGPAIGAATRWICPFVVVGPLAALAVELGNALERVALAKLCDLVRPVLWIVLACSLIHLNLNSLNVLAVAQRVAAGAASVLIFVLLRPAFRDLTSNLGKIVDLTRSYGVHVYAGRTIDRLSGSLAKFLVPLFLGSKGFGFLTLAQLISSPVAVLSCSLFAVRFRRIAAKGRVARKYVLVNLFCLAALGLLVLLGRGWLVGAIFGPDFATVSEIVPALVVEAVCRGAYQPYATAVLGWGDPRLKYISLVAAACNAALLPPAMIWFGLKGVAWAQAILSAIWFALVYGFYRFVKPPDRADGAGR